ncbi:glutaredoxin-like protein NrdH [Weissella uvarum]|uniref:glutaredoxin-like protein NrdH n=1 Tax=Weissella uvarum TaxID=1479233 RepID=UPI0019617A52|nr:glutaredoxin-like protein NrdH [Weissella uvarum]MBM7617824.1 glutaredoxin-like protein NrdH [Weissella uvarum]MCM0595797.1 glutaredoxin-like protein NrdH [Weissella uvarum]
MKKVTVYTKNNCVQCMMTKKLLGQYQVDFAEVNVEENPTALAELKEAGYQSVPVTFVEDEAPIVGFRPDLLGNLTKAAM